MTLEQLRCLHMIISEGTFHGAAKRLNKSQPALSHMIKKLEDELGFPLLSRENYRPALTKKGTVFHNKALKLLEEAKELKELSLQLSSDQEAEVHLAINATCPLKPLLSKIDNIRKVYPHTHIRLSIESMGGPIEMLMEEKADLAIATMDGVHIDTVRATPYQDIQILPVCHYEYPLASFTKQLLAKDLSDFPQIIVADRASKPYEQSRDVLRHGKKWTVSNFAAKKDIILSQLGWGGLPHHMIETELQSGLLKILDIEDFPIRHSKLMLMQKRDMVLGPVGHALWQEISDVSSTITVTQYS